MTAQERQRQRQLMATVDALEATVAERMLRALQQIRAAVTERELARILAMRDAVALHELTARLPQALRPVIATLQKAFEAGARSGGLAAAPKVGMRFNAVDPAMVQYAAANSARLVRQVTEETRTALRHAIARSFAQGIPPRDLARIVKPMVGLTSSQAAAVARRVAQNVASGMSRRAAVADAKRYAETLLRRRALTIARTEIIRSASQGQLASWRAATSAGKLQPGARKVWITTDDDRTCRFCAPMDGQAVALDEMFSSGLARVSAPPLHPMCRCAVALMPGVVRRAA